MTKNNNNKEYLIKLFSEYRDVRRASFEGAFFNAQLAFDIAESVYAKYTGLNGNFLSLEDCRIHLASAKKSKENLYELDSLSIKNESKMLDKFNSLPNDLLIKEIKTLEDSISTFKNNNSLLLESLDSFILLFDLDGEEHVNYYAELVLE